MADDWTTSTSRRDQDYAERLRQFEMRKKHEEEQLRQREEKVKDRYGDQLPLIIEYLGVYDEETKTIAVGYLTTSIAARIGTLDRKEINALAQHAISQAYRFEEQQREQLATDREPDRPRDEQLRLQLEPRQGRYYAELREMHRILGEQIEPHPVTQPNVNELAERRDEPSYRGRYRELGTAHRLVDVELQQRAESTARQTAEVEQATNSDPSRATIDQSQSRGEQWDSKRETNDRSMVRQARMREFLREIEEGLHNELDQDRGRDRGR